MQHRTHPRKTFLMTTLVLEMSNAQDTTYHVASCEWWKCDGRPCENTLSSLTTRHMASCGIKLCTKLCHEHYSLEICEGL